MVTAEGDSQAREARCWVLKGAGKKGTKGDKTGGEELFLSRQAALQGAARMDAAPPSSGFSELGAFSRHLGRAPPLWTHIGY